MRSARRRRSIEAELCAAVSDALIELGFSDFTIRINHRQLLTSMLNAAGIPEALHGTALVARRQAGQDRRGRREGGDEQRAASTRPRPQAARAVRSRCGDGSRSASRVGFSMTPAMRGVREPARRSAPSPKARAPAGRCASTRAWRAGSRTTRARSWRSTCPTSPAASAAAGATTTWSACSSVRAFRPADSRSASSGFWW